MLYNSDKQNFHSFILALLFSLIFWLFNEGSQQTRLDENYF